MNAVYFKDLAERVIATAAQAALAVFMVTGFDFTDTADLIFAGKAALVAAALSLVKGLAALRVGDTGTAGLVKLDVQ